MFARARLGQLRSSGPESRQFDFYPISSHSGLAVRLSWLTDSAMKSPPDSVPVYSGTLVLGRLSRKSALPRHGYGRLRTIRRSSSGITGRGREPFM